MKIFKNKKVYFLILVGLITLICIIKIKTRVVRDSENIQVVKIKKTVNELLGDIYTDVDNGAPRQILIDKIYKATTEAKSLLNKNESKTYLDLGKAYEVATLLGVGGAADAALESYNEYCKLEPNNPDCYTTLAKFLLLDVTRKKEALILARTALRLSRSAQETKTINELIAYMETLK